MQKKKIIFRADGNSQIGLGHVMRCLALGEMLKNNFDLFFAIQEPSLPIIQLLENESFKIAELPKTLDFKVDSENLMLLLDGSEIVVLDGYR